MLHPTLITASAVLLCSVVSAQSGVQPVRMPKHKVLGPTKNVGVYHVASETWTRGGNSANYGPGIIYRNNAASGYFGTGWESYFGLWYMLIDSLAVLSMFL